MQQTYSKDEQALIEIKSDPFLYTVAKMESNCNPLAENPVSSAKGIFQFIARTRADLGISDWRSPHQQLRAFKKLVAENIKIFKNRDPEFLYSVHYLGATLLLNIKKGKRLSEKQKAQLSYYETVLRPRFLKIYKAITSV